MKRFFVNIIRFVKRNPLYTSINITGLIIGFVCVVFIAFWIKNELSYDRSHQNADQIYRVHRYFYDANGTENLHLSYVAPPIAPLLKDEFPEIGSIARVSHTGLLFTLNNQRIEETDVCFAEPDITKIFTFEGIPSETVQLEEPFTGIVSDHIAQKYFKEENAVGNTLEFVDPDGKKYNLKVTGTFKDWGKNNHFRPEIIISFSTYENFVGEKELVDWGSNNYETFVLMPHPPQSLDARLDDFINKQLNNGTKWTKIRMERLTDIHFNWYGSRSNIYVLMSVALLILLLGSINYINLNTAIYTQRIKEIRVKRIIGASGRRIIFILMAESVTFCFISMLTSLVIVSFLISEANRIFNSNLVFSMRQNPALIAGFIILTIVIGVLSGAYPAKISVSRVRKIAKQQKKSLQNVLVTFQFFVSIALIMSFFSVNKQLDYIQTKDLGLDKENVVTFSTTPQLKEKFDVFRQELLQNPNIIEVSGSKRIPSQQLADSNGAKVVNNGKMEPLGFRVANIRADEHFLPTYKIKLLAGNKPVNQTNGEKKYLINRAAVEQIGWESPEAAIGQFMEYGGKRGKIVGVVENFHYESLHRSVFPIIIYEDLNSYNKVSVRVNPANLPQTLAFIEKEWQGFNASGSPFFFRFVDERFDRLYQSETHTKTLFTCFMMLAILIAVLGLIGLSLFVMERRTKEIGIRKVNGAKIFEVMTMLNKDFVKWVAIAFLIATPIAYYAMNKWLENFAYKTNLSWWIFALAGALAMSIALLTVSWQSWRAATRNPVEALRYE
jgi:putative ABC transport system permease protein